MELQQAVGMNIQRIRKGQKLSIDRLAEKTGVSRSMLGQIERGTVNPTVSILHKLAQGLHVPLEELVAYHEEPGIEQLRSVDAAGQRLNGGKVIRNMLFPYDDTTGSESSQMDIFISGSYEPEDQIPGSRVYVTCLSGTLELETGGEHLTLLSRDCGAFPGDKPYRYVNGGNNTVRLLERVFYKK